MLCNLTKRPEPALKLNGIWALMNMAFQVCTDEDFIFKIDIELTIAVKYTNNIFSGEQQMTRRD